MRFILGLIVGAALTVGVAYVHDTGLGENATQRFVNWPAVNEGWEKFSARARTEWDSLSTTVDRKLRSSHVTGRNDV